MKPIVDSLLILVGMSLLDSSVGWSSLDCLTNHCYKHRDQQRKTVALFASETTDDHTLSTGGLSPARSRGTTAISRRESVRKTLFNLIGGVGASTALLSSSASTTLPSSSPARFGLVQAAYADVTNKVASSTAVRALTRAQKQLPDKLLPEVKSNNFVGVKTALREPPFDQVRKNGKILVTGGEDGPKAKELVRLYTEFIASLEKIDSTASLGMRGREIDPFQMSQEYDVIAKSLDSFLKVGAEAAEIPLQEQPTMQESLANGSIETRVLTSE